MNKGSLSAKCDLRFPGSEARPSVDRAGAPCQLELTDVPSVGSYFVRKREPPKSFEVVGDLELVDRR